MSKPAVAIIGRPNVGKSTFFNYIVGKRISIVEDIPGVTRDRITADANWRDRDFTLIDTGGIEPESDDVILSQMRRQANIAINLADVIIFITDIRQGVTAADEDIALMLRKSKKPVILVCNKSDSYGKEPAELYEFYNLGLGDPYPVSAANAKGIGDVLDAIYEALPTEEEKDEDNLTIKVAIIGKPNVGKSTFFNYLAGSRISIVEDTPGVTRDRVYAETNWRGRNFTLIDTGGIEPESEDIILSQMREQANLAIEMADVIIFLTDIKQGVTAADQEIALMLKKSGKPIVLVCNKADNYEKAKQDIYEFYNLGIGDPYPISAANALGIGDVLDAIYEHFPEKDADEDDEEVIKVAVIGKPNVGKSSLINKILGENRTIVSDIAGTTRDAIDSYFENDKGKYVLIDTAGIRKKNKVNERIEKYSVIRSLLAIERADVCLMMIDANEGVTEQDTKIAGEAHEAGKGVIIVVNKWDEIEKETGTLEKYKKEVYAKLAYLSYAPIIFISAKTGQRVDKLFDMINDVAKQNAMRISTSVLNQVINEAIAIVQPPTDKGKRLKILYGTQASTKPPTFVIFVNNKDLFHFSYERYLVNQIRKEFGLQGTPIRIIVREKVEK